MSCLCIAIQSSCQMACGYLSIVPKLFGSLRYLVREVMLSQAICNWKNVHATGNYFITENKRHRITKHDSALCYILTNPNINSRMKMSGTFLF